METSRAKLLNNDNNYTANPSARKILPKLPESQSRGAPIDLVEDDPPLPSDPRKHLRSSLCFSGDALMVGGTPTTDKATAQARRSSAGQRISVGLPD